MRLLTSILLTSFLLTSLMTAASTTARPIAQPSNAEVTQLVQKIRSPEHRGSGRRELASMADLGIS